MISVVVKVMLLAAVASAFDSGLFNKRRMYKFGYSGQVENMHMGVSDSTSGFKFTCDIAIYFSNDGPVILNVETCKLYERVGERERESQAFTDKLKRFNVRISTKDGYVVPNGLRVHADESLQVLNIKRAMISAFQFKLPKPGFTSEAKTTTDVYGECRTYFKRKPRTNIITSKRYLSSCKQNHINLDERKPQSNIQQLNGGIDRVDFIPFGMQFKAIADCDKRIHHGKLRSVKCIQSHKFMPFARKKDDKLISFGSEIVQELKFKTHRHIPISFVYTRTKDVGIEFEFEDEISKGSTSDEIFMRLEAMMRAFESRAMTDIVKHFEVLVLKARAAKGPQLSGVLNLIKSCKEHNKKQKMVMEVLYTSALKSCGSGECIGELLKLYDSKELGGRPLRRFLIDVMMNHEPQLSTFTTVLGVCQAKRISKCSLLLAGMVRNYVLKKGDAVMQDTNGPIYKSIHYMRDIFEDTCLAKKPLVSSASQREEIFSAIKAMGNLGHIAQVYDKISNQPVVGSLLQCVENPNLKQDMVKASIVSLQRMNVDRSIRVVLLRVVKDDMKAVAIRTVAFMVLMRDEDASTIAHLHDLLHKERSTNMRTFMLSFVKNVMQSQQKDNEKIQVLWRAEIKAHKGSSLPGLDPLMFHKSRYTEMSRQWVLPLSQKNVGIQASLTVVYEPGNILPHSVNVNISVTILDVVYHIVEVGVDALGMESFVEALMGDQSLFGGKTFVEKLKILSGMVGKDMKEVRKMAENAKIAKQQIEEARKSGVLDEVDDDLDYRILKALPLTFDPSNLPKKVNVEKYLRRKLKTGSLPTDVDQRELAIAFRAIDAERGPASASEDDLPPGTDELIELVLFKPKYNYVKKNYRNLHRKVFEDVNYPRMSFPTGMFYLKTMGNEIGYVTIEEAIDYMQNFISMERAMEYFNIGQLMAEIKQGKPILFHIFREVVHSYTVIPSIIGVPLNMTFKATRASIVDAKIKAELKAKSKPMFVDISGFFRWRHVALMTGSLYMDVPTLNRHVGMHSNLTINIDLHTDGKVYYEPVSPRYMYRMKTLKVYHKNVQEDKELLGIRSQMCLKHWDYMEPLTGRDKYRTTTRLCSSPGQEQLTGRRTCWSTEYFDGSQADDLPYFPLTGPVTASYTLIPLAVGVKEYVITVDMSQKPKPDNPKHMLNVAKLQYEARDAKGSSKGRKMECDITWDRVYRGFKIEFRAPLFSKTEILVEWKETYGGMHNGPGTSWIRKDLIADVKAEGKKLYGLKYYRYREVSEELVQDQASGKRYTRPVIKVTLFGNYTMKDMSMEALLKDSIVRHTMEMSSDLTATYFCNMQDSPLYQLHMNPVAAAAQGHWTVLTSSHSFKKEFIPGPMQDWKITQAITVKYPGQDVKIDNKIWTQKMKFLVNGRSDTNYIDEEGKQQKLEIDGLFKSVIKGRGMDTTGTLNILLKNQFKLDIVTIMMASKKPISITADFDYQKLGGYRKRRSISDKLWSYERQLVGDVGAVGDYIARKLNLGLERMMSDGHRPVDWNNWKAKAKFIIDYNMRNIDSHKGGYLDMSFELNYPRGDQYNDIKSALRFDSKKYSYRRCHGFKNITFSFESTHLAKAIDVGFGYDGMMFGDKIHGKTYILTKDLKTGESWPIMMGTYDRERGNSLQMDVKFKTLRTDFEVILDYKHDGVKKETLVQFDSKLKSDIAPVLDYQLTASGIQGEKKASEFIKWTNAWFVCERNLTMVYPDFPNMIIDATVYYKSYKNIVFDGTTKVVVNLRGKTTLSMVYTQRNTGTIYFIEGELVNTRNIVIKTYMKLKEDGMRTPGLTWTLRKNSPHQIENEFQWSARFGDVFYPAIKNSLHYLAMRWSNMTIMYLSNINKSFMDKVVPYSGDMTVGDIFEKHIQPRLDDFNAKLDTFNIWGKPLGPMIRNNIKKVRAVRLHTMKMFQESRLGKIIRRLRPITRVRYLLGECVANLLRHWQKNPPGTLVDYWYRSYYPKLRSILQARHYKMAVSHPFIQETFVSMPEVRAWFQSATAWLRRLTMSRYGRAGGINARAITFPPNHVYTFNGRIFHINDGGSQCAYILSSDYKYARYSIVKTNDRVTFFSDNITFSIDAQNRVFSKDVQVTDPAKLFKLSIELDGPKLHATLDLYGVRIYCDKINQICEYTVSKNHYNHSMGLLGRNDEEYLSDFYTPAGVWTQNTHSFLNAYDVSGRCNHDVNAFKLPKDERKCSQPHPLCAAAFTNPHSRLATCFRRVCPMSFLAECNHETSSCDVSDQKKAACQVIKAYAYLCSLKYNVIFPQCVECGSRTMLTPPWTESVHSTVDYVIIMSTSKRMVGAGFPDYIFNLLQSLHSRQSAYALITYCMHCTRVHGDDSPFNTKEVLQSRLEGVDFKEEFPMSVEGFIKAMTKATYLKYRPNSHRVVIVFTDKPVLLYNNRGVDKLVQRLVQNSITVNVVSAYQSMDNDAVLAVGVNGVVPRQGQSASPLFLPVDEMGEAVSRTHGYMFHREQMRKSVGTYKIEAAALIKTQLKVPAGKCRQCKCNAVELGQGSIQCAYVPC